MTATVSELVILQMELGLDPIVRIPLVIVLENEVTCIKDHMLKESGRRREKETTAHLVKENDNGKLKDASAMKEAQLQKRNLNELEIGLSMSVHQERSTTTIANQKSHSGKNLVSGLTGKKTRNTNVTENDIDVIEIVIVNENMNGRIPLGVPAVPRIDIPVLIDLLCRIVIVTTAAAAVIATVMAVIATVMAVATVTTAICHRHVRRKTVTTIEITHHFSILCQNLANPEGIVMVSSVNPNVLIS